jgi:putative zinc finger protein
MDHAEAVRQRASEKYLLNELDGDVRDKFEEHLFDCQDCALDLRAGNVFVQHSKIILSEKSPGPVVVPTPVRAKSSWLGWMRPSVALYGCAVLLLVLGYQNLIMVPQLKEAVSRPQVLPWTSINLSTRGADVPVVVAQQKKNVLLFVNIPPDGHYSRYIADLYNPGGKLDSTLTMSANPADTWAVQLPVANRAGGTYSLAVRGITSTGESSEIGRTSFELQIQK